ncbi:hypothetical protein [Sphingobium sp. MK2]|uniref:hypothetical protein n=1 Tax=Sphingobium sp. MK2 TaxID=3116540 RepID=UPI0032E367F2
MTIWTEQLCITTRDLGRIMKWREAGEVDSTRQSLAMDVRSRAKEVNEAIPTLGVELTTMQDEYLRLIYSRCCDCYLAQHPLVAAWLKAYREA